MSLVLIYLVVIAVGVCVIHLDWCRRFKYGPSLDEQYRQTMADLDRELRAGIKMEVVRLRQEGKRLEEQQ